jgi:hypothetical protein
MYDKFWCSTLLVIDKNKNIFLGSKSFARHVVVLIFSTFLFVDTLLLAGFIQKSQLFHQASNRIILFSLLLCFSVLYLCTLSRFIWKERYKGIASRLGIEASSRPYTIFIVFSYCFKMISVLYMYFSS